MSAARSVQRMPLPRRAISSISPICIRHTPPLGLRTFHASRNTPSGSSPTLIGSGFRQSRQPSQQRFYATIVHNQKYNEDEVPLTLEITPSCAKQLSKVQARENNPNLMLRVTVESGGCHGYQYLMSLTEDYNPEEDAMFERDGTKVVVDTISLGLITGSKVDYSTELIGSQFKIVDNPAASSNCGCGASFDLDFSKQANGKGAAA